MIIFFEDRLLVSAPTIYKNSSRIAREKIETGTEIETQEREHPGDPIICEILAQR
jgi:hypothetical protein